MNKTCLKCGMGRIRNTAIRLCTNCIEGLYFSQQSAEFKAHDREIDTRIELQKAKDVYSNARKLLKRCKERAIIIDENYGNCGHIP